MSDLDLAALVDLHREELHGLPGVIGSGVGVAAIHIYVAPGSDPEEVRRHAKRVLGDAPIEVIVMEPPEAYSST